MTSRRLLILAALAVAVIAGALLISRHQATTAAGDRNQLLYPALKGNLDSIDAIRVFKAGDARVVEVKRNGTMWTVVDRDGYSADAAKVRKFLLAAAEATLVEEKTSNPAYYPTLGVEEVSAQTATGHRIEIGGTPINLIVGKQANGTRAQYVRRVGEANSWEINVSLDLPTTADAWLRKDIIDVAADRIQSFKVAITNGKPWTAVKTTRDDASFTVGGVPKGKELSSPAAANSLGSALTAVTLDDVQKSAALQADKPAAHATFRTFDGLIVEADGWINGGKHYIALTSSYDASLADRFKTPVAATQPATTAVPVRDVAGEVATQTALLAGWVYEIPEYKYEAIFKPLDELLKK